MFFLRIRLADNLPMLNVQGVLLSQTQINIMAETGKCDLVVARNVKTKLAETQIDS